MTAQPLPAPVARVRAARRAIPAGFIAMLLIAAVVVSIAAAVLATRSTAAPVSAAPARTAEPLSLVVGGISTALADGQAIPLAGDLTARVSLSRENGGARRLELLLAGPDGRPREATVKVNGQMRFMDHGSFVTVAMPAEAGRYVALLPFAMPGEYELTVEVTGVASPSRITLDLDLTR